MRDSLISKERWLFNFTDMKLIQLTHGKFTEVSDRVYEEVSRFKWRAHYYKYGGWYTDRYVIVNGKTGTQFLHQFIMGEYPKGKIIDHSDGNTLNNQDENLRFCTRLENCRNRKLNKDNKIGYKGVQAREYGRFRCRIRVDGVIKTIGNYNSAIEAAIAYDIAAIKYFGEFARTNFKQENDERRNLA